LDGRTVATVTTLSIADGRAIAEERPHVIAAAPAVSKSLVVRWESNNTTTGFEADCDPTVRQEIFNISETQAESTVAPNGMADDVRWKSISSIAGCLEFSGMQDPFRQQTIRSCAWKSDFGDLAQIIREICPSCREISVALFAGIAVSP